MDKQEKPRADVVSKGTLTHAKLRKAAAAVFAKRGFHATKVSDIVQQLGVSQPTFYNYFVSKEAAYEELVQEFRRRLQALTLTLLIAPDIPSAEVVDRVALSFRKFLDFLADDPDLTEIGFFQPPGCTPTKVGMATWIATNIAQEQQSGLFRDEVAAGQIGKCFVGMIDQMARDRPDAATRATLAQGCARLLCNGVWAKPT